jgi:tRNA(Ile)-lysidine synthase
MASTLLSRFKAFTEQEQLWHKGQSWLLAVSGGLDSVVLAHLCFEAGIPFSIAHCNFQLRGAESTRDEAFVRALAGKLNRPIYVNKFDTEAYAEAQRISIQVAARDLRYAWFRELVSRSDGAKAIDAIVTAHHLDDNIETLFMNFIKGTGVTGLRGMLPSSHGILRPLLFAYREELEAYAREHHLDHVEDSSNLTDKYNRNFIRHKVLPLIEERFPEVRRNMEGNLARFRDVEVLYGQAVRAHLSGLLEPKGEGQWQVPVLKLSAIQPLDSIVYELIKPFGFTPAQVSDVKSLLLSHTGHYVSSDTHRVIRDRRMLLISPFLNEAVSQVVWPEGQPFVDFPGGRIVMDFPVEQVDMDFTGAQGSVQSMVSAAQLNTDPHIACMDASGIAFPLLLRKWKPGDYFYPLGLGKKKKLARFFIDRKLSLTDKEKVWVLLSGDRIIWVIGQRLDDRVKVHPGTKNCLRLTYSMPKSNTRWNS